jgi:HEPN domain-containing protein
MALSDDERQRLVTGYIGAAARDLKAAEIMATSRDDDVGVIVAYHIQQCAEKLAKGLAAARGYLVTKEHRLAENIKPLESEPLAAPLGEFVRYDKFATTTRYPSTSGKLATGPAHEELAEDLAKLRALLDRARHELAVPPPERPTRVRTR